MDGITRINIISDWNDWRTEMARELAPIANSLYRRIFALAPGDRTIECTREEAEARPDWQEGRDVDLRSIHGTRKTLQEKFLSYHRWTVTFEERKSSGAEGAWYYCAAQYYFVGYVVNYLERRKRGESIEKFDAWMLIDLPALHREDEAGRVQWGDDFARTPDNPLGLKQNGRDGRRGWFRFIPFDRVPKICVVHAQYGRIDTLSNWQQLILF